MAANFRYHRAGDRLSPTWAISTSASAAAARTGYGTTQLNNGDPSAPFWADNAVVRLDGDFGSATRVDSVSIIAHNYSSSADLHLRMYSSSTLNTTSPQVDVPVTVPTPYADGFTYNLAVDLTTLYPSSSQRNWRYVTVANDATNGATVAIGEIVIYGSHRTLTRNVQMGIMQPRQRLTSRSQSKRGVLTVYDYGSVERRIVAEIPANEADFADLLALEADARGDARPFVVQITPDSTNPRMAEPLFVRLAETITVAPQDLPGDLIPVKLTLYELCQGELLGA